MKQLCGMIRWDNEQREKQIKRLMDLLGELSTLREELLPTAPQDRN